MSDAPVLDVAVTVVGAGPAGLAAATQLAARGVGRVLVLDREDLPGGLPAQSEHRGFGLRRHMIPLSGRRYAEHLVADATRAGAEIRLQCTAAPTNGTLDGSVCALPFGQTTAPNNYSATIAVSRVALLPPSPSR